MGRSPASWSVRVKRKTTYQIPNSPIFSAPGMGPILARGGVVNMMGASWDEAAGAGDPAPLERSGKQGGVRVPCRHLEGGTTLESPLSRSRAVDRSSGHDEHEGGHEGTGVRARGFRRRDAHPRSQLLPLV